MTVSVSWMSFWLDHKAVRSPDEDIHNMIGVDFEQNFVFSKVDHVNKTFAHVPHPGPSKGCFRGDHSPSNVYNTGFKIDPSLRKHT